MSMVALAALILTACSDKQSEMFNLIPKTSKAVLVISPADLAKKANLEKLNFKRMDAEVMQYFKDFFTGNMGVDPKQLVVFEYENEPWVMFEVTDESKLKDAMKDVETKSVDGCTVYKKDVLAVAVKDGLGWATDRWLFDNVAEKVNAFSKLQESEAISSVSSFADHMTGNDINVYVNIKSIYDSEMANMDKDKYAGMVKGLYGPFLNSDMYVSVDFGKNDLTVKSKVLDANGKDVMETMNLKNVDKDILKFFNEKSTLVAAVNMPDGYINFLSAIIAAEAGNDPRTSNIVNTIISSLEGNFAIGAYLKNGSNYYANDYAVAIKLKEGGADKIKGLVSNMAPGMMDENGNMSIPTGYGFNVNISFEDNYLFATNSEKPSATYASSSNASRFNDCYSALMLDMPTGSVLSGMATMATGADLSGYLYAGSGKGKNELVWHVNNNPEDNTLALILKIISNMQ